MFVCKADLKNTTLSLVHSLPEFINAFVKKCLHKIECWNTYTGWARMSARECTCFAALQKTLRKEGTHPFKEWPAYFLPGCHQSHKRLRFFGIL
jgi:hypothetical protein